MTATKLLTEDPNGFNKFEGVANFKIEISSKLFIEVFILQGL